MANTPSSGEVARYLRGLHYPVSKHDMIAHARELGADDNILHALSNLRDNVHYGSADDVLQAYAGRH